MGILRFVFRPRQWLAERANGAVAALAGLPRPWLGVHVRHGDLEQGLKNSTWRRRFDFNAYWAAREKFPVIRTVLVATDAEDAEHHVARAQALDPRVRFVLLGGSTHLREQS